MLAEVGQRRVGRGDQCQSPNRELTTHTVGPVSRIGESRWGTDEKRSTLPVSRICSISAYPTASDGRRFEREGPDVVYRALIADNEQSSFAAAWPKSKAGGH